MSLTALELFKQGEMLLKAEHEAKEKDKLHTLRGGSAGCLLADGTVLGGCPHEALARFMGYSLMKGGMEEYFEGGAVNEAIWEKTIARAVGKDNYRCESDIPVKLEVSGYPLTGRPDLVVGSTTPDGFFIPKHGYELKATMAVNSGASKLLGWEPDSKHLCQAGLYAHALGCEWSLVYTIMSSGELNTYAKRDYGVTGLSTGKIEFPIYWKDDVLYYVIPSGSHIKTLITWQGILDYYAAIVEMYETKKIGWLKLSTRTAANDAIAWGDPNEFNSFTLTVPVDNGWNVFMKHLTSAVNIPKVIKRKSRAFKVVSLTSDKNNNYLSHSEGALILTTKDLDEARDEFYA